MNVITPHSVKQEEIIFSDAEDTVGITGTQWGKTQAGTLWMQRQMFSFTDQKDNFLIAAPTYKILQQSIIPYFMFHLHGFGEFNKSEASFKLNNGGTCYFRTETDPDSIVGIPNVKAGWLDEAGKLRLYFYENYRARAAAKGAKTLLTTSPYSMNWLYRDVVKPAHAGKLPKVKLVQAASWENPHHSLHDPQKREEMRGKMDSRRFDMIFGGTFGKMAGLVFDCFEEEIHVVEPRQLPHDTVYYGGIDWGFTHPFSLGVRAVTPSGHHFLVSEFHKTGTTLPQQIVIAQQKMKTYGIKRFWADPSEPGSIEEFNRNGIPTEKADNDIRKGVDLHYDLIKSGKYQVFAGAAPYSVEEYAVYHYPEPEELENDDDAKEDLPVDQDNHAMDRERYLTIMILQAGVEKRAPKTADDKAAKFIANNEKRIAKLKAKNRQGRGSESWS